MKILFLTSNLNKIGGLQEYNKNLLKVFRLSNNKIKTLELEKSSFLNKIKFIFNYFFLVLTYKPDFIFCTHINFSYLGFLSKKILNIKYLIFTHGVEVWIFRKRLNIKSVKEAYKIISVSRHTAFQLEAMIPSLKNRVFILPNTVDEDRFKISKPSTKLIKKHNLKKEKIIFTLARINYWDRPKGYDQVIRCLPKVKEKYPNIKYLLGGKGEDVKRIKKLIKKHKLEDNVILTGYISDNNLVDYYNLSDLFVMPSKMEGFGIVFIEALACGKPVIAGDRDGARDALLDGELGFLVNPDDLEGLSKTITNILDKKVKRSNLIKPDYLRSNTIKEYGNESFKNGAFKLLSLLE